MLEGFVKPVEIKEELAARPQDLSVRLVPVMQIIFV
jgi:hypothetical protein